MTWAAELGGAPVQAQFSACLGFSAPVGFDCAFYVGAVQGAGLTLGEPTLVESCDLPEVLTCRGLFGADVRLGIEAPPEGAAGAAELAARTALFDAGRVACAGYAGTPDTRATFSPCDIDNGGCSPDAACEVVGGAVECMCLPGYTGDGTTCAFDEANALNCDYIEATALGVTLDPNVCLRFVGPNVPADCAGTWSLETPGGVTDVKATQVQDCSLQFPEVGTCEGGALAPLYLGAVAGPYRVGFYGNSTFGTFCEADFLPPGQAGSPCLQENGGCDASAVCEVLLDGTVGCGCPQGLVGDGLSCVPAAASPCLDGLSPCDPNAACYAQAGASCACLPGFLGDGFSCTPEAPQDPGLACRYSLLATPLVCTVWVGEGRPTGCSQGLEGLPGLNVETVPDCGAAAGECAISTYKAKFTQLSANFPPATMCAQSGGTWTAY